MSHVYLSTKKWFFWAGSFKSCSTDSSVAVLKCIAIYGVLSEIGIDKFQLLDSVIYGYSFGMVDNSTDPNHY